MPHQKAIALLAQLELDILEVCKTIPQERAPRPDDGPHGERVLNERALFNAPGWIDFTIKSLSKDPDSSQLVWLARNFADIRNSFNENAAVKKAAARSAWILDYPEGTIREENRLARIYAGYVERCDVILERMFDIERPWPKL